MTETNELSELGLEIEAVRTAEGYEGLNNFRSFMPGGYRYTALKENPDFGNQRELSKRKGLSLREFTSHANKLWETLGIDQNIVEQLQREVIKNPSKENLQKLNDCIFPLYRQLRLEGFSHTDCVA